MSWLSREAERQLRRRGDVPDRLGWTLVGLLAIALLIVVLDQWRLAA